MKKELSAIEKNINIEKIREQANYYCNIKVALPCTYCQKQVGIIFQFKCFYCGLYYCRKCAEKHFTYVN